MRYLIVFSSLILAGCFSTSKEPIVQVRDNLEKDSYINRLEHESSEAAAALIVSREIKEPSSHELVDITIDRLKGITKPTEEQVQNWRTNFSKKDFINEQKDRAKRVDAETDKAYAKVQKVENENNELKAINEALERRMLLEAEIARKDKASLYMTMFGGGAIAAGVAMLLIGLSRVNAFISIGVGILTVASVWIFDNPYMKWVVLGSTILGVIEVMYLMYKKFNSYSSRPEETKCKVDGSPPLT
jgi:hypothetical protein